MTAGTDSSCRGWRRCGLVVIGICWLGISPAGKYQASYTQASVAELLVLLCCFFLLRESRGRWSKRGIRTHSSQAAGDAADSMLKISRAGEWDERGIM